MNYLLIKLEFFSPYTSVLLYAEHGRGLLAPPPSTLIGALAAAYYHPIEREIPEEFVKKIKYAAFWVPPYTEVENISRHFTWLSQRKQRVKIIEGAVDVLTSRRRLEDVASMFKNYAKKDVLKLREYGYSDQEIVRDSLQILFAPATRLEVYYWRPAYALYVVEDELRKYAWNIFRIGPKETLVAATPVKILGIKKAGRERTRTRFYVKVDGLSSGCNYTVNYMLEKPGGDVGDMAPFCIPPRDGYIEDAPADGWVGILLETEEGPFEAIVPEYVAP